MWSKSVQEERWAISCATLSPGSWSSAGMPHCGQGHVHASKWPSARRWWSVAVSLSASAGLLPQPERGHEGSSSRRGGNTNRRILQPRLLLLPCLSLEPSARQIQRCTWPSTSGLISNYGFWSRPVRKHECESGPGSLGVDCHTLWQHKV